MFAPSRDESRRFMVDAWRKHNAGEPVSALERLAAGIVAMHPEYHHVLEAPELHAHRDYRPEAGDTNPFLHLALHLAVAEQLSIDQPPGIVQLFGDLLAKKRDRHEALHEAIECLAHTVWRAQRDGVPPDAGAYLDCLRARTD